MIQILSDYGAPAAVLAPLLGAILVFVLSRWSLAVTLVFGVATIAAVIGVLLQVSSTSGSDYAVGGWQPPLGITLVNDGLAATFLVLTSVIFLVVGLAARHEANSDRNVLFCALFLSLWASLNAHFLSGDLFNLYVTLELVGLSAVALTGFGMKPQALRAALNYLYVSLAGSLVYLMGVAIIYRVYGIFDIALLGETSTMDFSTVVAISLMFLGLAAKAALFPFHFWLPAAHASAAAPVSALLSAVVIKASIYLILRLWLSLSPPLPIADMLSILGAFAVLWGSLGALRAERLKLVIANSTVAQIGYIFLAFPLLMSGEMALAAIIVLILAHAAAKASMFLAAGDLMRVFGHDRLRQFKDPGRKLALTKFAFAFAGISIIGLPPTGGFAGKWLIFMSAIESGTWLIGAVLIIGSLLASAYVFRVLSRFFVNAPIEPETTMASFRGWEAGLLAALAWALGFLVGPVTSLVGGTEPW